MRILASADVHGSHRVYEWLVVQAREHQVDAVVLAGDLLGCPDGFDTPEEAQRHDAGVVARRLAVTEVPVLYIMGNDDLIELDPAADSLHSLHGRKVQLGHFGFIGYQYSLPFMGGTFEKPEPDIAVDMPVLAKMLDTDTVFISHSPAFGVLDSGLGETQIGSRSLLELLDGHPFRAHIHGHSHAGFGRHGRHFNVAAAGRPRAMLIDLTTMDHRVLSEAPSHRTPK